MDELVIFIVLALLGIALLLLLLKMLIHRANRRRPTRTQTRVTRSVVYLISGSHLLVMQQTHKRGLRARVEVPKGKLKKDETAINAAYRECYEESGLRPNDLQLLTVFSTQRSSSKRATVERWAAFWGTVPAGTTTPFAYKVGGKGGDRGRIYQYQLVPLETAQLHPPLDQPLVMLKQMLSEHDD
jgi:8-oxo-dGTP pyrophosphatase MutT (NUDIX family)